VVKKIAMIIPSIRVKMLKRTVKMIRYLDPPPDILIFVVPINSIKEIYNYSRDIFRHKKIDIFVIPQQRGLIEARNRGISYALRHGADAVWFFEDDTIILNKKIVKKVKDVLLSDSNIGIIYGSQKLIHADGISRPLDEIIKNTKGLTAKLLDLFWRIHGFDGLPYRIPAATLILTKYALRDAGLFYEGYGHLGEWSEPDLIYRILASGYNAKKITDFFIYHFVLSSKYLSMKYWLRRLHNFLLYIIRNRGVKSMLYIPLVFIFVLGSLLLFISYIKVKE
jgi:GT2 family glycosyltransferase